MNPVWPDNLIRKPQRWLPRVAGLAPYTGELPRVLDPFRFVLITVAAWMNQCKRQAIEYLCEQNQVLREQLGGRRVAIQRRLTPTSGCESPRVGAKAAGKSDSIVTPEMLLSRSPQ